ncbi:6207_t:CDS:10 [Cetraspora pellucida]|uniref:6207_t:CDS:1 n=1 Tax=Cetraspora pellucida TaxID=1433469 RepID=A0ACA9KFC8_9GLOM|nr:6207_t:CDS:10 [Cetraspora pellucida]
MSGVYSIAEVVEDSNKRPARTIFCYLEEGFAESQIKSLKAVANLVEKNGTKVFNSLEEVVNGTDINDGLDDLPEGCEKIYCDYDSQSKKKSIKIIKELGKAEEESDENSTGDVTKDKQKEELSELTNRVGGVVGGVLALTISPVAGGNNCDELTGILRPLQIPSLKEGKVNNALKNLNNKLYCFFEEYDEDSNKEIDTSELKVANAANIEDAKQEARKQIQEILKRSKDDESTVKKDDEEVSELVKKKQEKRQSSNLLTQPILSKNLEIKKDKGKAKEIISEQKEESSKAQIEISPKILANAQSEGEKMGVVKAFEFCYELSWKILKKILNFHSIEVGSARDVFRKQLRYPYRFYAYGSRVKGTARKFSDLDLCYQEEMPWNVYGRVKEDFEESNLPFKVDLVF